MLRNIFKIFLLLFNFSDDFILTFLDSVKSWQHEYTSKHYHNQPLHAISFSEDGCILAAAFGPSVVLKVLDDADDFKASLTHGSEQIRWTYLM